MAAGRDNLRMPPGGQRTPTRSFQPLGRPPPPPPCSPGPRSAAVQPASPGHSDRRVSAPLPAAKAATSEPRASPWLPRPPAGPRPPPAAPPAGPAAPTPAAPTRRPCAPGPQAQTRAAKPLGDRRPGQCPAERDPHGRAGGRTALSAIAQTPSQRGQMPRAVPTPGHTASWTATITQEWRPGRH